METEFRPTRVVEIETKWSKQSEARRAARYLVLPPLKEMAAPANTGQGASAAVADPPSAKNDGAAMGDVTHGPRPR
jgi:hypothetical protein